MLIEKEAKKLAEEYLEKEPSGEYTYRFSKVVKPSKRPNDFDVVFSVYNMNDELIDGPIVLVVNRETCEIRDL
jgi:hypothetical protein